MKIPFIGSIPHGRGADRDRIGALERMYSAADNARRRFEPDWYTNCLFLAGSQWEAAAEDVRRFRKLTLQPPQSKVRIVVNQILPLARQAASVLREHIAEQVAVPATGDEADVQAAALATDFLQSRYHEDNEQEIRLNEILWLMCTGRVLRKTWWNAEADSAGPFGRMPGAGDLVTATLSPFRFHSCPWTDCSATPPWIIESDVRDTREINDLFPGHEVQPEEYADATRLLDGLLTSIVGEQTAGGAARRKDAAILKRLYAAPTPGSPRGRLFVWANGEFLQEAELPEGEMPFVTLDWLPIPGRVYPLPFVSPLRDAQREINITLSQLLELKNRQLRGDLAVRGDGEITQEVDPATGRKTVRIPMSVQEYQFLTYDLRTSEAEAMLVRLHNEAMQLAGIHESSLGQAAPRAATATQVAMLKESDMSGLTLFRANFDNAYCRVARHKLLLARNHYHLPRLIRVVGENHAVKASAFHGSDLRGTQDVRPRVTPILTQSMIAEMKSQAAAQGLYGPYAGPTDQLAKMTALLNSGIPGAREEVETLLAPMTLEELRRACGEINRAQAASALIHARSPLRPAATPSPLDEAHGAYPSSLPQ